MSEFGRAAFGFPTALFTVLLIVVIGYWVAVLFGVFDVDSLDGDGGLLGVVGLGGVPITVAFSLFVAAGWFTSLAGATLLSGALGAVVVLAVALGVAWLATRLAVTGLRRSFTHASGPSRADFLGRPCVIRTGTVTPTFGQAEVTAADGSSALVQVRQTGGGPADRLRAGSTAYIYGYDDAGEFFWVVESPDQ
jgi:hypothetical protein